MIEKPTIEKFQQRIEELELEVEKSKADTGLLQEILDSMNSPVYLKNSDFRYLFINRQYEELAHVSNEVIKGKTDYDIFPKPVADLFRSQDEEVIKKKALVDFTETVPLPDGEHTFITSKYPFFDSAGHIYAVGGMCSDITSQKEVEKSLRESEERYRSLFENASDIIQVVQPDGQLLYVNPSWCNALGYTAEEANNLTIFDIIHPDCSDECVGVFGRTVTEGKSGLIETYFKSKDGKKVVLQGSANCKYDKGEPSFVHCIFQNITEKQRLEEELTKMHKLESVGVLAGGIAHDFNNILTAIVGNLSLARAQAEPGGKVYKRIEEAEKASLRAKDLTQQLLTFSKGGEPIKTTTSLSEVINDSCNFVLRGSNVRCDCNIPKDLSLVEADEGQISQVIHNLVINADQAMPEGGTININAENVHLSSKEVQSLNGGNYVLITLEDRGSGISEKHLEKIFDPYFSTKHQGHGLGLATAYSIIKNHGGLLRAESKQGEGSVFSIFLPASMNKDASQGSDSADIHFGKGSILLMDDEEYVREIGKEILDHLGYQVETAVNGDQVLEMYSSALQKKTPFDIVILDLTIPGGLGGKETIKKLIEIDPSITAIVSSGYANDPIMGNYKQHGFAGVVPKPYRIEDLSKALRSLLHTN